MEAEKVQNLEVVFEDKPKELYPLCSEHRCIEGHVWMPTIKVANCGGCGGPVVAIKMENCPICNQPAEYTRLRIDHIGYKQALHAICRGVPTNAEVVMAEMKRTHWQESERMCKELPPGSEPAHTWNMRELERRVSLSLKDAQTTVEVINDETKTS